MLNRKQSIEFAEVFSISDRVIERPTWAWARSRSLDRGPVREFGILHDASQQFDGQGWPSVQSRGRTGLEKVEGC